jgi:hypothetical protein
MKIVIIILFMLSICNDILKAQTTVGGTISSNTTWSVSGNPYTVNSTIIIPNGITLTIKPGVILKFENNVGVDVYGTLNAEGKADSLIIFTSAQFIPSNGHWRSIYFSPTSSTYDFVNGIGNIIKYSIVEYGGGNFVSVGDYDHVISIENASPFISNSIFRKNQGLIAVDNIPQNTYITNNKFFDNIISNDTWDLIYSSDAENDTLFFKCNLIYNHYSGNNLCNFFGNEYISNNLFIGNEVSGFEFFFVNKNVTFEKNQVIDNINNMPSGAIFSNMGKLRFNTVTRNKDLKHVIFNKDSNTVTNNNNLFNNSFNPFTSPNYTFYSPLVRQQFNSPIINSLNNYWGTTVLSDIGNMVFDKSDDTTKCEVDYSPFLNTLDTTAPVSPVLDVIKTDLGGGNIQVTWSPNLESDIAGYKIYYGNPTGYSFSNFIDVGFVNTYTLSGFNYTDTIAVTAYDNLADDSLDQCDCHESWFTYDDVYYLGITESQSPVMNMKTYPNPFNDFTRFVTEYELKNAKLTITNNLGQNVKEVSNINGFGFEFDCSELSSGIYIINIIQSNQVIAIDKWMKLD